LTGNTVHALQFFNWYIISWYWVLLVDFGQTAPVIYSNDDAFGLAYTFPPASNIFLNETLFNTIYSFAKQFIFPLLNGTTPPTTTFLESGNQWQLLQTRNVTFVRNYSCIQRQFKGWWTAFVSVLYTFTVVPYSLLIFSFGSRSEKIRVSPSEKFLYRMMKS
jgi:hypothetical protein